MREKEFVPIGNCWRTCPSLSIIIHLHLHHFSFPSYFFLPSSVFYLVCIYSYSYCYSLSLSSTPSSKHSALIETFQCWWWRGRCWYIFSFHLHNFLSLSTHPMASHSFFSCYRSRPLESEINDMKMWKEIRRAEVYVVTYLSFLSKWYKGRESEKYSEWRNMYVDGERGIVNEYDDIDIKLIVIIFKYLHYELQILIPFLKYIFLSLSRSENIS